MSKDERTVKGKEIIATCKAKEGSSDADEAEALVHKMPSTTGGKCIHACIGESLGYLKDGKLSDAGLTDIINKYYDGNEKVMSTTKKMAAECADITDADRCEMAYKIMVCSRGVLDKLGLEIHDIF